MPNIERLKELQNLLAKIPDTHFNLGIWLKGVDYKGQEFEKAIGECGTSGCAVGWACTHKPFNEQGLTYALEAEGYGQVGETGIPMYAAVGVNNAEVFSGFDAVCAFFELDIRFAWLLFAEEDYGDPFFDEQREEFVITPADVSKRIGFLLDHLEYTEMESPEGADAFEKLLVKEGI